LSASEGDTAYPLRRLGCSWFWCEAHASRWRGCFTRIAFKRRWNPPRLEPTARFWHPPRAGAHVARAKHRSRRDQRLLHGAIHPPGRGGSHRQRRRRCRRRIEVAARRLKLDFIPSFVEDYYLLGKRETVERADVETIVALPGSDDFAALVKEIPGYDTSHTGKVTSATDVIG
jgi:hypothetical protein